MLPAINRSAGQNIGFPDPCLTPVGPAAVKMPYLNIALHGAAVAFSPNVMLSHVPALNIASIIPITQGDEAGVASPMIKQAGRFKTGSGVVHVNFLPGINLTCMTTGNNMNNALGAVLAPGATNVFFTLASKAPALASPAPALGSPTPMLVEPTPVQPATPDHLPAAEVEALLAEIASAGRPAGPPVTHRWLAEGIAYLAIDVFSADVPARVFHALKGLGPEDVALLVLDLRDNPGGELDAFVELAGDFLPGGALVCTVVDDEGDATERRCAGAQRYTFPVAIVVNERTASAAELFAHCLDRHGRAVLAGGPTHGKNTGCFIRIGPAGDGRRTDPIRVSLPERTSR